MAVAGQLVPIAIACLPEVLRAKRKYHDDGHARRCNVNKMVLDIPSVGHLIRKHNVPEELFHPSESASNIIALALARADFIYDALRPLDTHQKAQRKAWALLAGGCSNVGHLLFFTCAECVKLKEAVKAPVQQGSHAFVTRLPDHFIDDIIDDIEEQHASGAPEWLDEHRPALLVRMPSPFAALLAHGATNSFSLCNLDPRVRHSDPEGGGGRMCWSLGERVKRDHPEGRRLLGSFTLVQYPADLDFAKRAASDSDSDGLGVQVQGCDEKKAGPATSLVSDCFLDDLADRAREALCAAMYQHGDQREKLEWLHVAMAKWQQECDQLVAFKQHKQVSRGQRFSAVTLIYALIQANCLKKDSDLRKVCMTSLELLLPREMVSAIGSWIDDPEGSGIAIPSAPVISRLRGRVDACLMITYRNCLHDMLQQGGVVLYPAIDSSPQAGRDYEVVVLNILRRSTVPELYQDVVALENRRLLPADERVQRWEEERKVMDRIRARVIYHMAPPGFLGTGRTSLPMKFRVVFHCLRLLAKDRQR